MKQFSSKSFLLKMRANEQGIVLLNAIIATGFVALMVIGLSQFLDNRTKESVITQRKDQATEIYSFVLKQISQPSAILNSSVGNGTLRNCLFAPGVCNVTNTNTPLGSSYNATASNFATTGASVKRAGTVGAPSFYDTNGMICTTGSSCIYQVVSYFRAICPNNVASCPIADEIETRVVVSQKPGTTAVVNLPNFRFAGIPRVAGAIDTSFKIRSYVREIVGLDSQVCSPGSVQIGVAPDRHIICRCLPEYPEIGFNNALKQPICAVTNRCPVGLEARGIQGFRDPNPGSPICVRKSYRCSEIGGNYTGNHNCPSTDQQLRASSANPFIGCIVDYPNRKDHINVRNGSMSCPQVRINCCENPNDGT